MPKPGLFLKKLKCFFRINIGGITYIFKLNDTKSAKIQHETITTQNFLDIKNLSLFQIIPPEIGSFSFKEILNGLPHHPFIEVLFRNPINPLPKSAFNTAILIKRFGLPPLIIKVLQNLFIPVWKIF